MAKGLSEREVASVRLLIMELSEDELTVLTAGLTGLLKEPDDQAIKTRSGASRHEVEAILQDLDTFLQEPTRQSMTK